MQYMHLQVRDAPHLVRDALAFGDLVLIQQYSGAGMIPKISIIN